MAPAVASWMTVPGIRLIISDASSLGAPAGRVTGTVSTYGSMSAVGRRARSATSMPPAKLFPRNQPASMRDRANRAGQVRGAGRRAGGATARLSAVAAATTATP